MFTRLLDVPKASFLLLGPRVRDEDLAGLRAFLHDYPPAEARLLYGGSRRYREGAIEIVPFRAGIRDLPSWL